MNHDSAPDHVKRFLDKLEEVRPTRDGWDALCPCPNHNGDGDQHASLRVTLGDDGRILVKCRVGCMTDAVLDAIGLAWPDLFLDSDESDGQGEDTAHPTSPAPRVTAADPDLIDRAYRALLEALPLEEMHRKDLHRRGLTDVEIDRRFYRSLRNTSRRRAAKAVYDQIGDAVLGVPGFARGPHDLTLHGDSTGLLVPVRDLRGSITALKIRRATEPKYVYLTGGDEGLSPGSPVHVPLGVVGPASRVRVTEGELKSDVCTAIDGTPTIGVPGVTQWRPAIAVLQALQAKTVVMAFDAPDVHSKPPVFEQAEALWQALAAESIEVELENWDE